MSKREDVPIRVPPGTGGVIDERRGVVLSDTEDGLWVELPHGDYVVERARFVPDRVEGEFSTDDLIARLPKARLEADKIAWWRQAARGRRYEFAELVKLGRKFERVEQQIEAEWAEAQARVRAKLGPDVTLTHEERVRRWRVVWAEWPWFLEVEQEAGLSEGMQLWYAAQRALRVQEINDLRPDTTPVADSPALEAAIRADPDAVEPYLVYADWLQGRQDPRGELIALMAEASRTPEVEQAIEKLLEEHAHYLLGTLPHHPTVRIEWRWGFIEAAHVRRYAENGVDKKRLLEQLLDLPAARFLRTLTLVSRDRGELVEAIVARSLPTIRRLYVDEQYECDLTELPRAVPRVEELVVRAGAARLGRLELERLRSLRLELGRLEDRGILASAWPELERLELTPGARGLLRMDRAQLCKLTCISLRHPSLKSDLNVVGLLGGSPLLRAIRKLELWACTLSPSSAQAMLDHRQRFAHLEEMVLPSGLDPVLVDRLSTIGPQIHLR